MVLLKLPRSLMPPGTVFFTPRIPRFVPARAPGGCYKIAQEMVVWAVVIAWCAIFGTCVACLDVLYVFLMGKATQTQMSETHVENAPTTQQQRRWQPQALQRRTKSVLSCTTPPSTAIVPFFNLSPHMCRLPDVLTTEGARKERTV